ncbi:acyltransferase family protein [Dankookia sp. GCM10030260]|uniref:acyltransferase family protein n=1 Tax=Dankookia sp. GCM10030260 TaxID=3273390 RepID=UPI00360C0CC6
MGEGDPVGQGGAPRRAKERLAWPDLARGACMVLVVLLHSDHALRHVGQNDEHLHLLNELLVPLRQPLFFLISGMLGAGVLGRGAQGVLVHRVGRYLWLFLLWWVLGRFLQLRLDPYGPFGMEPIFTSPPDLARLFATGQDDHWFFYALAAFFGLALVLSRLPGWLHAAIALLLAVPGLLDWGRASGISAIDQLWYYPFFAFGARRSAWLWTLAPRLGGWPALLGVGLLWAAGTRVAVHYDPLLGTPATAALALLAMPAGLGMAVRLAAWGGPLARGLILVGRNTLPIYVLHPLVMRVFFLVVPRPEALPRAGWVLLATGMAVAGSFLLGRVLGRIPGLFGLPPLPVALLSPRRAGDPQRESA